MRALKIDSVVSEAMIEVLPALQPFLGHKVQMIALAIEPAETPEYQPGDRFEQTSATGVDTAEVKASQKPTDPLGWPLDDVERGIWEALPTFRAQHPLRIATLEDGA